MRLVALAAAFISLVPLHNAAPDSSGHPGDPESVLSATQRRAVAGVPYSNHPLRNTSSQFQTRFSVPAGTSWQAIFKRPTIVRLSIDPVPGSTTHQISVGDVQAVFPIDAKELFKAVIDYGAYPRITPHTVLSLDRSKDPNPLGYHKRIQMVSASILGFGQTYLFVTNNYEERLGDDAYGAKWNLEQSLDGRFYSLDGSWYVRGMQCDGTPCSYLRYFAKTGFVHVPPVPRPLLRIATAASFRNLLTDFYNAAVRMQQAEKQSH